MIQKFLSKYGLSVHLAVLAALPLALTPFLTAATLGSVILWLSAFAAVWFFTEPSLRRGEHISSSRARLRRELIRDPMFWFLLVVLVYALIRWLNSGIVSSYDPEAGKWLVRPPAWSGFPASTGSAGFLPWCVALAATLVVLGLRNGVGASARVTFGVVGSFLAGLGGLVAAACACAGIAVFSEATKAGFAQSPFWASGFGVWLVVGLVAGVVAESNKWSLARIPFIFGVAGNFAALLFFAPPLVTVGWFLVSLAALAFSLVAISQSSSMGSVTRGSVLAVFGFSIPVFMVMTFMPSSFVGLKAMSLNPEVAFPETYASMSEALTRIARSIWMAHPWFGSGEGVFALQLPFFAEKADWAVLPVNPTFACNGVMMLLAERGVFGLLLIAVGLGYLVTYYGLRLVGGWHSHREQDEGGQFLFSISPMAWTLPLAILPLLAEIFVSPIAIEPTFLLAAVVPLVLAASSFPKGKSSKGKSSSEDGNKHSKSSAHRE